MTTDNVRAGRVRGVPGARWQELLAFVLMAVCVAVLYNALRPQPLLLEIDARVETSAVGQVFYSRDGAYSEDRSERFELELGQRKVYRVSILGKLPRTVRLDLGDAPGDITLYRVEFHRGNQAVALDPGALARVIQPLSGVEIGQVGDGLSIASLDTDPHFAVPVPDELRSWGWGGITLVSLALLGLIAIAWLRRSRIRSLAEMVSRVRPGVLWPVVGVIGTFLILRLTGVSLSGDRPFQSLLAGSGLMLAITAFAVVGLAALRAGKRSPARLGLGFAGNAILGQAILFLYIYVRSLPGAFGLSLPVTGLEILILVVACGIYLVRRGHVQPWTSTGIGLTALPVAVLFVLCVVVADRELPRLVMLSSDPDAHAFFARQVMHFGGVPWQQGGWGEDSLNYPAGTGVLIAAWSWISRLDVRDAASALGFLSYCLAALALAHQASHRARGSIRVGAALMALALLFAAYMMPLHMNYVHMEGLGRVVAFGFLASVGCLVLAVCRRALEPVRAALALGVLMFVLVCLNPVNLAAAGLMVGAGVVWSLAGKRWREGLALVLSLTGVALVVVDPYFFSMMTGRSAVEKVALEGFDTIPVLEGVRAGFADLLARPAFYLGAAMEIFPGARRPPSILLMSALVVTWCVLRRQGLWRPLACVCAVVMVAAVALAISQQFSTDKRFFLLAPYLPVALAQAKILLVMSLSIAIVTKTAVRRHLAFAAVLGAVLVCASALVIRPGANFFLAPKHDYCGGVECPVPDDVAVLSQFREHLLTQGIDPNASEDRLLIANRVIRMGRELWLFPSGGGRLAPHSEVGPVAFFYFQGDPDYTTHNYVSHVCERFDIPWLREQKVRYVLVPATEGEWCIHDVDSLVQRWETVAVSGNARVIDLNREVHVP